jgi:DNA-binding NarL/FixJ family response regulator
MPRFSVLICDDHELISTSLSLILSDFELVSSVHTVSTCKELFFKLNHQKFDVLILDLNVKGENMLEKIEQIKAIAPEMKILILTSYDAPSFKRDALSKGVNAYLDKNSDKEQILCALRTILEGGTYLSSEISKEKKLKDSFEVLSELTSREIEIIRLLVKGYTNQKIADELNISIHTVQTHRKNLKHKLDIKTTGDLVALAYAGNLV